MMSTCLKRNVYVIFLMVSNFLQIIQMKRFSRLSREHEVMEYADYITKRETLETEKADEVTLRICGIDSLEDDYYGCVELDKTSTKLTKTHATEGGKRYTVKKEKYKYLSDESFLIREKNKLLKQKHVMLHTRTTVIPLRNTINEQRYSRNSMNWQKDHYTEQVFTEPTYKHIIITPRYAGQRERKPGRPPKYTTTTTRATFRLQYNIQNEIISTVKETTPTEYIPTTQKHTIPIETTTLPLKTYTTPSTVYTTPTPIDTTPTPIYTTTTEKYTTAITHTIQTQNEIKQTTNDALREGVTESVPKTSTLIKKILSNLTNLNPNSFKINKTMFKNETSKVSVSNEMNLAEKSNATVLLVSTIKTAATSTISKPIPDIHANIKMGKLLRSVTPECRLCRSQLYTFEPPSSGNPSTASTAIIWWLNKSPSVQQLPPDAIWQGKPSRDNGPTFSTNPPMTTMSTWAPFD